MILVVMWWRSSIGGVLYVILLNRPINLRLGFIVPSSKMRLPHLRNMESPAYKGIQLESGKAEVHTKVCLAASWAQRCQSKSWSGLVSGVEPLLSLCSVAPILNHPPTVLYSESSFHCFAILLWIEPPLPL